MHRQAQVWLPVASCVARPAVQLRLVTVARWFWRAVRVARALAVRPHCLRRRQVGRHRVARCRSAVGLRRAVRLARFRSRRVRLPLALLARCLSAPAPVALARAARLLCRLALLRPEQALI